MMHDHPHPKGCDCPMHRLGAMTLDEYCEWEEAQIRRNLSELQGPVVDIELGRALRAAKDAGQPIDWTLIHDGHYDEEAEQ